MVSGEGYICMQTESTEANPYAPLNEVNFEQLVQSLDIKWFTVSTL
jgi:hypothetical protein